MELNLEAIVREANNNISTLNTRCMALAGENEVLKQNLLKLEKQIKELSEKLKSEDNVVPIKTSDAAQGQD